ncbi:MAG: Polyprenol monophosphomannose synthase [Dehalococcoidia bacterium]|nr:Polyprenol monophosphomannose synthase [Chloroflexota bacterium]
MGVRSEGETALRPSVAVVIPCYKVTRHIKHVIDEICSDVDVIYCVDDHCPEGSGAFIEGNVTDPRVRVIRNEVNKGVGGAVMAGYRRAIEDGMDILVKVDGDGQMDPALLRYFVAPIASGEADYTKGNRFWDLRAIRQMPLIRRVGNLGLSFMAKFSSGYWDIFDPTNGYTAIHARVAERLPHESISSRYFFETDMLFRLNTLRASVVDVPMDAKYGNEESNLDVSKALFEFSAKHLRNFLKRIGYNYFLRDLSIASAELVIGLLLGIFAIVFGSYHWLQALSTGNATPVGTIMIATVAAVSGLQFVLAFIAYDIANMPKRALHPSLQKQHEPRS